MPLKLYNLLSRKKETFRPLRKNRVGLYTCGPTVYNFAHIGNLRTYIFEDILRRTLEYAGYKVRHVMNITDVEDKIIRDAKKAGKSIFEFTKSYEKAFFKDLKKLGIEEAWKYPKATRHIKEMVAIIQALLKKKLAYKMDSSVYFDISKFKKYGHLACLKLKNLKSGVRIDADEYAKDSVQDFVLWKGKRAGEPSWKAPFGEGRPGWHIECSAMSMKYLGKTFDIHTGGVDNIFPHHENEIAQSEGATGKKFVRLFVEGEHLLVNGEKMSKSLGNIYTLRDIESRGFSPFDFRYLVLTAHYRSKLNFTWESLQAAQNSLKRLHEFVRTVRSVRSRSVRSPTSNRYRSRTSIEFETAVFNDLDTPQALAVVWDLVHQYNQNPDKFSSKEVLKLLYDFDEILGLGLKNVKSGEIPQKIMKLAEEREEYRKNKLWDKADRIRKKIRQAGFTIEDTSEGPKVKPVNPAQSRK